MAPTIAASARTLSFTNTPLLRPDGNSEPEISIASNGSMGMVGLSLGLASDRQFGTSLWTGPFGSTPTFQGIIDSALQQPGRVEFGGEDADVDFGATGALHLTTLIFLGNPTVRTDPSVRQAAAADWFAGGNAALSERDCCVCASSGVFISAGDRPLSPLAWKRRKWVAVASWRKRDNRARILQALDEIVTGRSARTVRSSVEKDQRQPRSQIDRDRGTASWSEFSLGLAGRSKLGARGRLAPDGAHFLDLGAGWDDLSAAFTRTREAAQV